jgi:hypothetical protein
MSKQPGVNPAIVLVHGAFAGVSSWNSVSERLQQQGCSVVRLSPPTRPRSAPH